MARRSHPGEGGGLDPEQEFPVFTLAEANARLPEVIAATRETIRTIAAAETRWASREGELDPVTLKEAEREELGMLFSAWAQRIVELGAMPKGAFTVDFQSEREDDLYCWSYGEPSVGHTHKTWESFKNRVPLDPAFAPDAYRDEDD